MEKGRMIMALGPHGEQIDVRRPGTYKDWHERAGLTCIVCAAHVHVYRPRSGTLWMRHNQSHDEQRCAASGPEGYEHSLLKYWVRNQLRLKGYDAECERQAGAAIPDVRTVGTARRLAVEVQLVHLPDEEAQRRTEAMQAEGYHVLWLTHHHTRRATRQRRSRTASTPSRKVSSNGTRDAEW